MNRKCDGDKWIQRGLVDTPPQTLPSKGLWFPQGDELSAVSDGPESKAA